MKTFTKEDFEKSVKMNDLEVFTPGQIKAFVSSAGSEIEKSIEGKEDLMKSIADEVRSLTPNKVWGKDENGKLDYQILMTRPSQVEWDSIEKSNGTYKETNFNKTLDRVGKKVKEEEKEEVEKSTGEDIEKSDRVKKVMEEFKAGELKDSSGNKVTDEKQAMAIAMSEEKEKEEEIEKATPVQDPDNQE